MSKYDTLPTRPFSFLDVVVYFMYKEGQELL